MSLLSGGKGGWRNLMVLLPLDLKIGKHDIIHKCSCLKTRRRITRTGIVKLCLVGGGKCHISILAIADSSTVQGYSVPLIHQFIHSDFSQLRICRPPPPSEMVPL